MERFLYRWGLALGVIWPFLFGLLMALLVADGHLTLVRLAIAVVVVSSSVYAVVSLYRGFLFKPEPKALPALLFGYAVAEVTFGIAFLLLAFSAILDSTLLGLVNAGPVAVIAYGLTGYWCAAVSTVGVFLGLCAGHPSRSKYLANEYLKNPFSEREPERGRVK